MSRFTGDERAVQSNSFGNYVTIFKKKKKAQKKKKKKTKEDKKQT